MYEIYESLLKQKGVKTADVCKATGLKAPTFSDWKKGKSSPNADKLILIAKYFGVSVEYLRTGVEPEIDYLYSDSNAEFLLEITRNSRNKDFVERMTKYMSLMSEDKKSVDDMIDFIYDKAQKKGD